MLETADSSSTMAPNFSPIGNKKGAEKRREEKEEEAQQATTAAAAEEFQAVQPATTAAAAAAAVGWSRFRQWFHCFCVVTFDLELGQTIEVVYPGDAQLTAQERSDLCYASFPDSNSTAPPPPPSSSSSSSLCAQNSMHNNKRAPHLDEAPSDSMHHFRIRRASFNGQKNCSKFEELVPVSLWPDPRFFHCFSFFRRQRDPMLPRGYFQKSIVLVSLLPFVPFFQRVLAEVALAFFTNGETAIETVCFQIDRHWPPPTCVGCPLSLPLVGLHFQYIIPDVDHLKMVTNGTSMSEQLLLYDDDIVKIDGHSAERFVNLYNDSNNNDNNANVIELDHHFHEAVRLLLPHLQLIWELILLGEPLLLLAPTASLSSALVHALITLISPPLRYYGDYRPFFTIHDTDFAELSARQNCCVNNFVLGVTNPFFLKAFAHWPHILKIGHNNNNNNNSNNNNNNKSLLLLHNNRNNSNNNSNDSSPSPQQCQKTMQQNNNNKNNNEKGGGGAAGENGLQRGRRQIEHVLRTSSSSLTTTTAKTIRRLSDHAQLEHQNIGGLLSTHRQFLTMDKLLTRKLFKMPNELATVSQWHLLKRHFAELTQSFISPLERYIASLLPLRRHLCPFQPVPSMRPFSLDHFLSTLQHFGHPGVKGDWQGLYRQFVTRSPNFIGWLQQRRKHIERQLHEEHLELLCTANLSQEILRHRNQVEIVDLVLKFRDRLAELEEHKNCGKETEQQDQHHQQQQLLQHNHKKRGVFSAQSPMKRQSVMDRQRTQLQQQLNCLLSLVDDDLKNVLMSNNTLRKAVVLLDNVAPATERGHNDDDQ